MNNKYQLLELNEININNLFDLKGVELASKDIFEKDILTKLGFIEGIIYNYDSVEVGRIEDIAIDLDNIIEARIFNKDMEIRVMIEDDKLKGSIFNANNSDEFIKEEFKIIPRGEHTHNVEVIVLRKYIDYDEDNQAYISYLKPRKFKYKEIEVR